MSITTSDSSRPAVRRGSSGSNSAYIFDLRGGSTSGVSVFVALGSSGAVSATRVCPCVRSAILCNNLARFACPDGGVTDSPGRIGGGSVALTGAGSLLPLAGSGVAWGGASLTSPPGCVGSMGRAVSTILSAARLIQALP